MHAYLLNSAKGNDIRCLIHINLFEEKLIQKNHGEIPRIYYNEQDNPLAQLDLNHSVYSSGLRSELLRYHDINLFRSKKTSLVISPFANRILSICSG